MTWSYNTPQALQPVAKKYFPRVRAIEIQFYLLSHVARPQTTPNRFMHTHTHTHAHNKVHAALRSVNIFHEADSELDDWSADEVVSDDVMNALVLSHIIYMSRFKKLQLLKLCRLSQS